jgi:predicted permease
MTPISHIASLNTPLAMLMFGTYLSKTELKKMFLRKETYAVAFIKLIIVPLISLAAYKLLGMTGLLLTSLTISASAPTATSTVMFATKYGRDNGAASQTIAVVSFLSIITMPVMIALAQAIG